MTLPFRRRLGGNPSRFLFLLVPACLLGLLYVRLSSFQGVYVTLPDDITIDDVIRGNWNYDPGPLLYLPRSCRPRSDLVLISGPRCGAEAVGAVLRRYGYRNNLSLVLPVGRRAFLGWPYPITAADLRPSRRGYNLLVEHAVYNGTFLRRLMNRGAPFVTVLRHPFHQFASTLDALRLQELASHSVELANVSDVERTNVSVERGQVVVGPLGAFLRDIHGYESRAAAAVAKRLCVPDGFSLTRNPQSHGLGMPLGFPAGRADITDDRDAVESYIRTLDAEFVLVMIAEYLDESLVLLRRLMCWDTKDILCRGSSGSNSNSNQGGDRYSASFWRELTRHDHDHDRDLHRRWSRADYALYDHFNRTFWSKVRAQGEDFLQEVSYFRRVRGEVTWFCNSVTPYGEGYIQFPESVWSPAFTFSSEECRLAEAPLLERLKERYDRQEPREARFTAVPEPVPVPVPVPVSELCADDFFVAGKG